MAVLLTGHTIPTFTAHGPFIAPHVDNPRLPRGPVPVFLVFAQALI